MGHWPVMTTMTVAAVFDEIADLLELQDANPFHVRAYRNAARTLLSRPEEMAEWAAQHRDFDELPGLQPSRLRRNCWSWGRSGTRACVSVGSAA